MECSQCNKLCEAKHIKDHMAQHLDFNIQYHTEEQRKSISDGMRPVFEKKGARSMFSRAMGYSGYRRSNKNVKHAKGYSRTSKTFYWFPESTKSDFNLDTVHQDSLAV